MIRVSSAAHKDLEAVFGLRLALRGIGFPPVLLALLSNRAYNHGDRSVEGSQRFILVRRIRIRELLVPVSYVTRFRDTRPDVVIQISCQMQHQVPHAVSVWIRLAP